MDNFLVPLATTEPSLLQEFEAEAHINKPIPADSALPVLNQIVAR